ncbi:predicted protein [Postia placenta Mad-698-R]|nr:predicted protein [Postia placenta Mad-698-R]
MCGTLDEWHQLSTWTDFDNRSVRPSNGREHSTQLAMLADADAIVTDVSFLEKVVRPCIQQQKPEDIEDTLSAYYDIMEHRAHHIDRSQSPPWLTWDSSEQDSGTIETLGQISVDVLSQIPETLLLADDTPKAHVKRIDNILWCLLRASPRAESAVYSRLIRLLPTPELPHVVLDMLVDIIASFGGQYRLDIEDTRRLLTFLSHARERLSTERFLRITNSALQHSARLPLDHFGRVRSDVRGALDVVVEYFSSPGIEGMTQAHACPDVLFKILNDPVAGENVSLTPAPRDVDEAPREHPEVVGDTPMQ